MTSLRSFRQLVVVAMVCAVLQACATSPIGQANTTEQKAYAAYGSFVIAEEEAGKLTAATSTVPAATKQKIIVAVNGARPVVQSMLSAYEQYKTARADFEASKITQTQYELVLSKLNQWRQQAEALVAQLVSAVRGGQ